MTADWCPISIRLQSSNEFTTTARVFPRRIWKTECLYCFHQPSQIVAWSSPRLKRWPTIGNAPGISGRFLMNGMSVAVRYWGGQYRKACWRREEIQFTFHNAKPNVKRTEAHTRTGFCLKTSCENTSIIVSWKLKNVYKLPNGGPLLWNVSLIYHSPHPCRSRPQKSGGPLISQRLTL